MKIIDAINLIDQVWRQVPLIEEVNSKVREAIKEIRDFHDKNKEKTKEGE